MVEEQEERCESTCIAVRASDCSIKFKLLLGDETGPVIVSVRRALGDWLARHGGACIGNLPIV